MLQPRKICGLFYLTIFIVVNCNADETLETPARVRRGDGDDVTTVLLVDNQGRSTFGRFLSVKPDLGLLTSTARTFIQEGVTTQYATQVLGTTLDNGRLYAHLLTKSSRVLYDNDLPTRSHNEIDHKKWNINNNLVGNSEHFIKNTDYVSPNKPDPYLVFPTSKPKEYRFTEKIKKAEEESTLEKIEANNDEPNDYELLKSSPSNNARVPNEDSVVKQSVSQSFSAFSNNKNNQNNVKVFQIHPRHQDVHFDNLINYKENENVVLSESEKIKSGDYDDFVPSKVRATDSLPTFTVRNEFMPSGLSYLGDFPDFDINTERSKATTAAERKAKFLFRKPSNQDLRKLPTVTYSGFADFTTVVGDTVIVFAPFTSEANRHEYGKTTSIRGEATLLTTSTNKVPASTDTRKIPVPSNAHRIPIPTNTNKIPVPTLKPSSIFKISTPSIRPTIRLPQLAIKPSFTVRRPKPSKSYTSQDFEEDINGMQTVVIDASDRQKDGMTTTNIEHEDVDAKSSVLANEQKFSEFDQSSTPKLDIPLSNTQDDTSTIVFTPEIIKSSKSEIPMLSTPSEEDIAKIFALLQAQNNKATEPLKTTSTTPSSSSTSVINTASTESYSTSSGGATTIFFDEEAIENTAVVEDTSQSIATTKYVDTTTPNIGITTEEEEEEIEEEEEEEEVTVAQPKVVITTTPKEETTIAEEKTTPKQLTTIEDELETTNEILSTSDKAVTYLEIQETTPKIQKEEEECIRGSKIVPTTVFNTLTYLTTFFIPVDDTTTTSIKSNEVVSTEVNYQTLACTEQIAPTAVFEQTSPKVTDIKLQLTTNKLENEETTESLSDTTVDLEPTIDHVSTWDTTLWTKPAETTPLEITTEKGEVTESIPETTEMTTENGEEIEVLFKTLYTTYTYLTTFFQESTSSIESRKVVITNVITSTLEPGSEFTDQTAGGIFGNSNSKPPSFDDIPNIKPTSAINNYPTRTYSASEEDIGENILDHDRVKATPALDDETVLQSNSVKTYYTTYTYLTTVFVDGETEISSRTEVYTNYITPSIKPTETSERLPVKTDLSDFIISKDQVEAPNVEDQYVNFNVKPINYYNSTISRDKTGKSSNVNANNEIATTKNKLSYSTLSRGGTESSKIIDNFLINLNDYDNYSTMVTDVRSSTSTGESQIIENGEKRNVLDDQIVAESNNDSDIIPSPTLLLQTSYTTFTYFTTMYQGTTSSNVASRLETVTNVVTETLTPTHTLSAEDLSLPITYFTTFTYWTTLYKEGITKVTSREETVSNVITPTLTATVQPTINITPVLSTSAIDFTISSVDSEIQIQPTKVDDDELTTYFTTYTYYTTSYVGNSTVLNSRLETLTNIANETAAIDANQIGRAIGTANNNQLNFDEGKPTAQNNVVPLPTGLLSTIVSTVDNSGLKTVFSTDIYGTYIDGLYAKVLESTSSLFTEAITPTKVKEQLPPTGVVSINQGKIVDAEGISTLFYTTQAIGTLIDNLYAQVIESTSSLVVNEERKSALVMDESVVHRTGLVRLIEGSIVQNHTTTLYESKVIGTVIDGRYAQIIESTSSFIIEKTEKPSIFPSSVSSISPTATQNPNQNISPSNIPISPSPVVIEGSLNDSTKSEDENTTEGDSEEEDEDDSEDDDNTTTGRKKSRLTFQSRKPTFTPAIRPFASRGRPTFVPKRKGLGTSGALTITRSDFTPTVTAVPASKGNRFGGKKSSSTPSSIQPTASSSRRFARPKSSSNQATQNGAPSSSFIPRGKSSSKISPTAATGSRKSIGKTSSQVRPSSAFAGNSRFARVRPTPVSTLPRTFNSKAVTPPSNEIKNDENGLTTQITENPTYITDNEFDTTLSLAQTTETVRRNQNPLLKLRRPPLTRASPPPPRTPIAKSTGKINNNKINSKVTATTPKPKTTRPPVSLQGRRPANGLLPRRNLFTTSTTQAPEEEEEEDEFEGEDESDDTDYEGSNTNTQTEKAPTTPAASTRRGRANNVVSLKPFKFRSRSKRETTFSRFRKGGRSTAAPKEEEIVTDPPKTSKNGRFKPRSRSSPSSTSQKPATSNRVSPSRPNSSQGRAQFTLRERDKPSTRSTFKRTGTQQNTRKSTTVSSRPKAPKLRNQHVTEAPSRRKPSSAEVNSRSSSNRNAKRPTNNLRTRASAEQLDNFVLPNFNDGTITITHSIPTEITIPVVNGQVTEYRNVVTAKYSMETLIPKQYSTAVNSVGKVFTVLRSDSTNVSPNGATEITRYVLNETPTTTVIFTPTYIRGHKTSWSHVLPSTVYGVEQVVSTIKPPLAAQAPLANILLSQLLLGNPGIQQNALLGFQNPPASATPTTEFKTRTTTYVTTVTSATSTVIPITFRGKEILTTIIDSSVNVITATEFVTDTVVVTPTVALGGGGLNSLLLPLLLQQQQQPTLQQPIGLQQGLFQEPPAKYDFLNFDDNSNESEEYTEQNLSDDVTRPPRRKSSRKKSKSKNITPAAPPKETSIITLYVSGKTPGEFSTVLSTVIVGEENQRRKRDVQVAPSKIINKEASAYSYMDSYVSSAQNEDDIESMELSGETESLESVLGDVRKHIVTNTPELFEIRPTKASKSKNLTDLSELSLLTPKVETSMPLKRGDEYRSVKPTTNNTCVSSFFGKCNNSKNLNFNINKTRIKRQVDNLYIDESLPKYRIVKKLIRVQPIYNKTLKLNEEDDLKNNSTRKRNYRRRLVIKKKPINRQTNLIPSTVPPRRKIVVTKKRLISKSASIQMDVTSTKSELVVKTALPSVEHTFRLTDNNVTEEEDESVEDIDGSGEEYEFDEYDDVETTTGFLEEEEEEEEQEEVEETTAQLLEEEEETTLQYLEEENEISTQELPNYELSFPELLDNINSPVLSLKTTVLSSVTLETKTVVQSRLRTYTSIITRFNGNEKVITSTTEVKPQTKTLTLTEPSTTYTTLTLLDLDATETLPFVPLTVDSSSLGITSHYTNTQEVSNGQLIEEGRFNNNLATRIMSNGVEVIVASDKSTLPGEPDIKRILPTTIYKPITLRPSIISDVIKVLPKDGSSMKLLSSSMYHNQFVTKTCLTTFTYLTTYLQNGSTTISSHEQVVSNVATEARNPINTLAPSNTGIVLTHNPNLAAGTFMTTYTYLNTIFEGGKSMVVTSRHTVTNTVTAPDDLLAFLKPLNKASALRDTNTYYSTVPVAQTVMQGTQSKIVSTNEVLTQIVITESVPQKSTSVMTSYIALDFEDNSLEGLMTTDVVKTYFVTYTYYNTLLENDRTVVETNISTSSDVITEKLFLYPKRTQTNSVINTAPITNDLKNQVEINPEKFEIHTTKTYVTTFTYYTTLLQENNNDDVSTVVSSQTRTEENVVTESVRLNDLHPNFLKSIRNLIAEGKKTITQPATLTNGQRVDVTVVNKENITPTKVLPIEKTQLVTTKINPPILESSDPNVITGSTIIFFDDEDPFKLATPSLTTKVKTATTTKIGLGNLLSSEIVKDPKITSIRKQASKSQIKKQTTKQTRHPISTSKTTNQLSTVANSPIKKKTNLKIKESEEIPALLGLGSINMPTFSVLEPVFNAIGGLIKTNLNNINKDENVTYIPAPKLKLVNNENKITTQVPYVNDNQNRSPIYIPIGADQEPSESQNVDSVYLLNDFEKDKVVSGQSIHGSPLLSGGIPISPGEIITTNSDVIVGRPGRIGPRIPIIPLIKDNQAETPIDMKPPPEPQNVWFNRDNNNISPPIQNGNGKRDDYVGPPPPPNQQLKIPLRSQNFVRGEKHKIYETKRIPFPNPNPAPIEINYQNNNRPDVNDYPVPNIVIPHIPPQPIEVVTYPIHDFNVQPSILNEPNALPEVIERSTGQPLLVNLQPSQVAFVNIPHNRTTALIYGGSTELHKNGQYFDDPSPYPDLEFSVVQNYDSVKPQYGAVFDSNELPNQKQLKSVIKVTNDVINNQPSDTPLESFAQIHPSRTTNEILHKDVDLNVPPISFELVRFGDNFNGHVINHNNRVNSIPYFKDTPEVITNSPAEFPSTSFKEQIIYSHIKSQPENVNFHNNFNRPNIFRENQQFHQGSHVAKLHPNEKGELQEYLTPPKLTKNSHYNSKFPIIQKPPPPQVNLVHPPIINEENILAQPSTNNFNKKPIPIPFNLQSYDVNPPSIIYPMNQQEVGENPYLNSKNDDLLSEAGELTQESNSRPLLSGELPLELWKNNLTSQISNKNDTNNPLMVHNVNFGIKVAEYDNYPKKSIQKPRPFEAISTDKSDNPPTTPAIRKDNPFLIHVGHKHVRPFSKHNITFGQRIPTIPIKDNFASENLLWNNKISHYTTTAPVFTKNMYLYTKRSQNVLSNIKRPHVTSMPVNSPDVTHKPIVEKVNNYGSQTEEPFNSSISKLPSQPVNTTYSFNNKDVIPIYKIEGTTTKAPNQNVVDSVLETQTSSQIVNTYPYGMEIMKPPPLPQPATNMQPPKIEIHSPSEGIHRVPNLDFDQSPYDQEGHASSSKPIIITSGLPPKITVNEEVLGMSPPPRDVLTTTTQKPTTTKSNHPDHPYQFETPYAPTVETTSGRPFTRRPFTRKTTIYNSITRRRPTLSWQRPITPIDMTEFRKTTESPLPANKTLTKQPDNMPTMEVIIGKPNGNLEQNLNKSSSNYRPIFDIQSSEASSVSGTQATTPISITPSSTQNFTTGIHHGGNEIKIVDDDTTTTASVSSISPTKALTPKPIIPTKYITHTKTSTVTITKTTVIKTLGGPPSTMTILVTKTEKSTLIDTVTEFHTLVKPTSIIETITTTVNHIPTTLYRSDVQYGSVFSYPIEPSQVVTPNLETTATPAIPIVTEGSLDEFIIHETDPPPQSKPNISIHVPSDNDSIFVVMTDKKQDQILNSPNKNEGYETDNRDDVPPTNKVNHVLLGGILIASPPSLENSDVVALTKQDKCNPECKASKNELCQKAEGIMRCVCRPGFARMFPDRPCRPTYTYSIKLGLDRYRQEKLQFKEPLKDSNSTEFIQLAGVTHEALDRMVMQSDLRDIYHGVYVHSYEPMGKVEGVLNNFYLQLSDNTDDQRLNEIFKRYLRSNNYSLGGTELFASKAYLTSLAAEDFDECGNSQFHDCSEHAQCFNLPGTYTCSCKEGYSDLSENSLYPGRICSAELIGCEKCHYHGTCYSKGEEQVICECFQWYAGEHCHINLKVLLIALITLGILLFVVLFICIVITCARKKPRNSGLADGMSFMPQRMSGHGGPGRNASDRRAMIQDTSSESSQSDTNTLPYVANRTRKQSKGAIKKVNTNVHNTDTGTTLSFAEQKDRSLPVMIPRAKYHPASPTAPVLNMETFDKRKSSAASSNEAKLLSYLDAGPCPSKSDQKRKYSKQSNDSRYENQIVRKISGGALVSAGFEVSATVGGSSVVHMGTLGTNYGTEADRSENGTLIQKISADLLSSTGTRSQFTTFRKSLVGDDLNDPLSNWLDIPPKVTKTVSEARSYDETTIQPPTKPYRNCYDSKPSSQHQNDEANTMAERDLGSTFLLPHTHLYKPDRGSDISGFDSL